MGAHNGPKLLADNYTVRVFTSSGIFTPAFTGTVEILVVAGGGGAGSDMGGGGGGGGVISNTSFSVTAGTPLTVTVGAGGAGAPAGTGGHATTKGTNGANSVFGSSTAVGGGAGGTSYYTFGNSYGEAGGSGGGGSGYNNGVTPALATGTGYGASGAGTAGQGNRGGWGRDSYYSGGGGGAGAAGTDANATPHGGAGILNSILDLPLYWGGGGGGASYSLSAGGNGGIGGGGGGAVGVTTGGAGYNNGSPGGGGSPGSQTNTPGGNGGQFTGGGGGGGSHYNFTNKGGDGGSGIVIVRYISTLGNSTGGSPLGQSPLKFMIDMGNTLKSWKGPPATNVVPNADIMSGWSNYYRTTASSTFITEFGTTGYRFTSQPSWNGVYRSITIPSTGTYTFSAWVRYLGGSPSNNGAQVYVSGWGGNDSAVGLNKTLTGVWQRISITLNCTNTTFTFYLISYGGTDNGTGNPDNSSWEVTMPQAEAGSVATPFVAGTRSNTQALLDITKQNTITATSVTYASNNTFSFGGSHRLDFTLSGSAASNEYTRIAWIKPTQLNTDMKSVMLNQIGNNSDMAVGIENYKAAFHQYTRTGTSGTTDGDYTASGSTTLSTNTVYMIAVTVNRNSSTNNINIYLNGQLDGTASLALGAASSDNVIIGGPAVDGYGGARMFYGDCYIATHYNRALTAREVQQNFNATRGRFGI
jgi:hypothetical protein